MAIAFVRAHAVSRAKGQSIVACAAYRECGKLRDDRHDKIHDYSKKSGHIAGALVLPSGVELSNEELWNSVEESEKRIDARLGKEFIVALPKEFSEEDNKILAERIAKVLYQECRGEGGVDHYAGRWDIHAPHVEALINEEDEFVYDEKGKKILESNCNCHVHYLVAERCWDFKKNGFSSKKDRNRNSKDWLAAKKLEIGIIMNEMLKERGLPEVDFRDFETRNQEAIERTGKKLDLPQRHKGPAKSNAERKSRRRRARRKNSIKTEIKECELELKKMERKTGEKTNSASVVSAGGRKYVPDMSGWGKDVEREIEERISERKLQSLKKGKNILQKPSIVPDKRVWNENSRPLIVPSINPSGRSKSAPHGNLGGQEIKCLICIPDGSERCKKCRFRDDEKNVEYDSGYSR